MKKLDRSNLIAKINHLAASNIPFIFLSDYMGEKGYVLTIEELKSSSIAVSINNVEIGQVVPPSSGNTVLTPQPISRSEYAKSYDNVMQHIHEGNTYLLNLTAATFVGRDISFKTIYSKSEAHYKLLFGNEFVFYSPETFVRIIGNEIFSYPMKGTISASVPNAENVLMNDHKERCEHYTIVDLIRNDLALVSNDVEVSRFRYVERLETSRGGVLQTSSEVKGVLQADWKNRLGDIIFAMLPAGSISGAPKEKTCQIIAESETCERGFYTGIMGYFDGSSFDSCVNIRFMHRCENGDVYYHSGGGITFMSNIDNEYNELINKVYVPFL